MKYTYFVAYAYTTTDGFGFGNISVDCNNSCIDCHEIMREVESIVSDEVKTKILNLKTLTLTNFILLKTEEVKDKDA